MSRRIRIESPSGEEGFRVVDAETGEPIEFDATNSALSLELEAGEPIRATLTIPLSDVSIEGVLEDGAVLAELRSDATSTPDLADALARLGLEPAGKEE